jgi:hypothetical protein
MKQQAGVGGLLMAICALSGALVAAKLIGWISWGWLWCLSPLWMPVLGIGMIVFISLIYVLYLGVKK